MKFYKCISRMRHARFVTISHDIEFHLRKWEWATAICVVLIHTFRLIYNFHFVFLRSIDGMWRCYWILMTYWCRKWLNKKNRFLSGKSIDQESLLIAELMSLICDSYRIQNTLYVRILTDYQLILNKLSITQWLESLFTWFRFISCQTGDWKVKNEMNE